MKKVDEYFVAREAEELDELRSDIISAIELDCNLDNEGDTITLGHEISAWATDGDGASIDYASEDVIRDGGVDCIDIEGLTYYNYEICVVRWGEPSYTLDGINTYALCELYDALFPAA